MLGMWIQNIRVTVGKDPEEKTEVLGLYWGSGEGWVHCSPWVCQCPPCVALSTPNGLWKCANVSLSVMSDSLPPRGLQLLSMGFSKQEYQRWVACQAPLSMGFSRQEYWSGLPFPSPETRKLLEENLDNILFDTSLSNIFLDTCPQAKEAKVKIN